MKPEQLEIDRLRKEVAKLKSEPDTLKRPQLIAATAKLRARRTGLRWRDTELRQCANHAPHQRLARRTAPFADLASGS
ncbi:hypothetical protein X760_18300 [Mesorhizobium sp. LSHC422A00]|nr:hypothetical protein X761_33120 [Mesorhizobium sp. LSHC424B00]ESX60169.1 hypothetical protein X760_18300 [Mesorhizobium sp. LSHC422A00]ESX63893.1 hypothetical protein X758_32835 [Mesorhizobium sp. LSHC416B00]